MFIYKKKEKKEDNLLSKMKKQFSASLNDFLKKSFGEKNLETSKSGLYTFASIALLLTLVYSLTCIQKVPTPSMEPTIQVGDFVVTNKYVPLFLNDDVTYNRGDVVTFCYEGTNILRLGYCTSDTYVKRIVGLPGEKISFEDGVLLVNGKEVEIDADIILDDSSMDEIIVGENEFFVAGDNRGDSMDSRLFGPVKYESILGKTYVLSKK